MGPEYTTVTAAPSGSETPLVKTTTPFCTQPEISICQLSPGPVVNSSAPECEPFFEDLGALDLGGVHYQFIG
jgi:hypothetical protein